MTRPLGRGRARRARLGQHFLVDRGAAERIVDALGPGAGDALLEIGPGRGALTGVLVARAGRVLAVELDPRLAEDLRRRFSDDELVIVREDILRFELARAAPWLGLAPGTPLLVAGNLPYGISKPVARKLVAERSSVSRAVLMFQREVAERLTASPGQRAYAPLTVLVSLSYHVLRLFELPPAAFRPRPSVRSTVTLWRARAPTLLDPPLESRLVRCLAASFRRRRQTLHNNLRAQLGSAAASARILESAGLDGALRAESVPPAGFLALARVWPRAL
jgi:16S rRNA (adenine1518-N6/adenine1519-N6)-dimethyltransferase